MDIQQLIELDKEVLLALNGHNTLFWDGFMWTVTKTLTWIPVGAALLYVIFKNNKLSQAVTVLLSLALCITLADQITSGLCKPLFERFRPTQDPDIMYLVHTVNGYRGGMYGFMSSHAANTFAVAMFVSLLVRNWMMTFMTFTWAMIASYSRIYLGVHYPGDIFCGALVGLLVAAIVYWGYLYVYKKKGYSSSSTRYGQNQFTSSGYALSHLNIFYLILLLTCVGAVIAGMMQAKLLFF